eukprot:36819-Eustigmatos_ZCMA.PRE.1
MGASPVGSVSYSHLFLSSKSIPQINCCQHLPKLSIRTKLVGEGQPQGPRPLRGQRQSDPLPASPSTPRVDIEGAVPAAAAGVVCR